LFKRSAAIARVLLFTFSLQSTLLAQAPPPPPPLPAAATPRDAASTAARPRPPQWPVAASKPLFPSTDDAIHEAAMPSTADLGACEAALNGGQAPHANVSQNELWPANHVLRDVGLAVDVSAACESLASAALRVYADEPDEDQTGDGDQPHDAQIDPPDLFLRAERKGNGDGRVYLVLAIASTAAASGTACATVVVPTSQSAASLASVRAQAAQARSYCDAHDAAPPGFILLEEGPLGRANQPPQVDAGPDREVTFPGVASLDGTVSDDGLPTGILHLSWTKVSGPGTVTFGTPAAADTTASFSAPGRYTLRLTADDTALSRSDTVEVVVTAGNEAPDVSAGPDQVITLPQASVSLAGVVTDDGRPSGSLSVLWTVLSGPGPVVFGNATQAVTTASFTVVGTYVLRLTASDGELGDQDDVEVTLGAEALPALTIGDATTAEGQQGTTGALVNVTLSKPWPRPVSVDYVTADGSATAGCDYRPRFGTVTLPAGQTQATVLVPVMGELVPEGSETVRVLVGNPVEATLARTEAALTITDDDGSNQPPRLFGPRTPADRTTGLASPSTLTWSATDADVGDSLTHDVYLGTEFGTTGQSWSGVCAANAGPGPRDGAAFAYDEANDRLILFGGTAQDAQTVWVLTNATGSGGASLWVPFVTTGGPGAIRDAVAAFDPSTNRLVVHGGCTGSCDTALDETWVLSNANGLGGSPA
jgi:hypothetical protein